MKLFSKYFCEVGLCSIVVISIQYRSFKVTFWTVRTLEFQLKWFSVVVNVLISLFCSWSHLVHFQAQTQKIQKNPPWKKNSFYFGKWNFLTQILKRFLIFSQKKAFLIFSQKKIFLICTSHSNPPPKNSLNFWNFLAQISKIFLYFLIFSKMELSSFNILKKFPMFSYISWNGTLHFSVQALKIKELHLGNPKKQFIFNFAFEFFP